MKSGIIKNKSIIFRPAQAILELAVFGSIILMLMGVLINYGLRYNFQQKAMMNAFRQALTESYNDTKNGQPLSTTVYLVEDRHIPDPAHPLGEGEITPIVASSAVSRNYQMDAMPENPSEYPQVKNIIDGKVVSINSGIVHSVAGINEKYKMIFGSSNIDEDNNIVFDSAVGESTSYDMLKQRCRIISDAGTCLQYCQDGKYDRSFDMSCSEICSQSVPVPAYCGRLDELFRGEKGKFRTTGLQNYSQQAKTDNSSFHKKEGHSSVDTTASLGWSAEITRKIFRFNYNNGSGGVSKEEVKTGVSETGTLSQSSSY